MAQVRQRCERRACDPVTLQIVRGGAARHPERDGGVIERTAMSPFIREKKDFYAALFDGHGRLIVGSNLPVFGDVVGPIAEHYPLETCARRHLLVQRLLRLEGAVSHSPTRCSWRRCSRTASCSPSRSLGAFQRHRRHAPGLAVARLHRDLPGGHHRAAGARGARRRDGRRAAALFFRNSRFPEMVKGDTRASMAAIRLGERRLASCSSASAARGRRAFARSSTRPSASVRRSCARWSRGRARFTDTIDSDGQGNGPIKLRYRLEVTATRITLDTSESDDQVPGRSTS
jgi:N-methylhydantoinase B